MEGGSHLLTSHYDVLGAPAHAEYAEIRSKYRAAILALHPDKLSGTNGQSLKALNSASNEIRRVVSSHLNEDNGSLSPNKLRSTIKDLDVENPQLNSSTTGDDCDFIPGECAGLRSRFLRVQKAWEVLRDTESRDKYDKFRRAERLAREINSTRIIGDEIHLQEMDWRNVDLDHGKDVEYSYPCRCGDLVVISQEELRMAGAEVDDETLEGACRGISGRSDSHRPRSYSLLLPCQSCSMHVRLLLSS